MNLHISKISRTFDVRKLLEQSNLIFLKSNKAQAACESQAYYSVLRRVVQRPERSLKFSKMHNMKKKPHTKADLAIIKTELESSGLTVLHVLYHGAHIRFDYWNPADKEKIIAALSKPWAEKKKAPLRHKSTSIPIIRTEVLGPDSFKVQVIKGSVTTRLHLDSLEKVFSLIREIEKVNHSECNYSTKKFPQSASSNNRKERGLQA